MVAAELKPEHPERFRPLTGQCRHGAKKPSWAFTKPIRLKRDGRKRLVIMHEKQDFTAVPRWLVTEARQWESGRVIETWGYRWASAVFHACGKQVTGVEAAQVGKEEAVNRHVRLSGVAPSIIQRAPASASPAEREAFAEGKLTDGQRCHARGREVMRSWLELMRPLFTAGQSCEE